MVELILATLLLGSPVSAGDTLLDVRHGDRLVLGDFRGEVEVVGWDRDYLAVESDSDEETRFEFERSGNQIVVQVMDRKGRNRGEELTFMVPRWVDLDLSGRRLEVEVRGIEGSVKIRNLSGELTLEDLGGRVDVTTASGEITATGLDGVATLKTGGDDLTVRESSGVMDLETLSGDIELSGLSSESLSVRTTSGEIDFAGRLFSGGEYQFRSHSGDVTLQLEGPLNIDVSVLAYEGAFESEFPVRAKGFKSGQEMAFTIGTGGGTLILEAFNGEISLLRGDGGTINRQLVPNS
jgi:hypothetical protein